MRQLTGVIKMCPYLLKLDVYGHCGYLGMLFYNCNTIDHANQIIQAQKANYIKVSYKIKNRLTNECK